MSTDVMADHGGCACCVEPVVRWGSNVDVQTLHYDHATGTAATDRVCTLETTLFRPTFVQERKLYTLIACAGAWFHTTNGGGYAISITVDRSAPLQTLLAATCADAVQLAQCLIACRAWQTITSDVIYVPSLVVDEWQTRWWSPAVWNRTPETVTQLIQHASLTDLMNFIAGV